jgi:phage tail-like protein
MATLNESYTFTIEDLTKPTLESILWIDPRRCRIRFSEPMDASTTLPGTLALAYVKGGVEILEDDTIQLLSQTPLTTWVGYHLALTGSVHPTNNRTFEVLSVDTAARQVVVDTTSGVGAALVPDTGTDKTAQGHTVRTRTLRLSVSPYKFSARLSEEGADYPPDHEDRIQCTYLPVPIAASLPEVDEIPSADQQEQYVVLDFHDDVSFERLYTVEGKSLEDAVGNVLDPANDTLDFQTPSFGAPPGRKKLWDLYPHKTQVDDLVHEGELRKMAVVLQDLANSMWYRTDQLEHVLDPATTPRHLLDWLLHRHGNPFSFGLDTEQKKRRLLGSLRSMYRKLGTVGGIEAILEFFLEGTFDVEPFVTAGNWILNLGMLGYVNPSPPPAEFQYDTMLGGGGAYFRNCYLVRSYRVLTDAERQIITEICEWADPVNMHLVSIVEPGGTEGVTFWTLNVSILNATTTLNQ